MLTEATRSLTRTAKTQTGEVQEREKKIDFWSGSGNGGNDWWHWFLNGTQTPVSWVCNLPLRTPIHPSQHFPLRPLHSQSSVWVVWTDFVEFILKGHQALAGFLLVDQAHMMRFKGLWKNIWRFRQPWRPTVSLLAFEGTLNKNLTAIRARAFHLFTPVSPLSPLVCRFVFLFRFLQNYPDFIQKRRPAIHTGRLDRNFKSLCASGVLERGGRTWGATGQAFDWTEWIQITQCLQINAATAWQPGKLLPTDTQSQQLCTLAAERPRESPGTPPMCWRATWDRHYMTQHIVKQTTRLLVRQVGVCVYVSHLKTVWWPIDRLI